MKAQMKVTINKKLFWNIKFYETLEDTWNVVGYVFKILKWMEPASEKIWNKCKFGVLPAT